MVKIIMLYYLSLLSRFSPVFILGLLEYFVYNFSSVFYILPIVLLLVFFSVKNIKIRGDLNIKYYNKAGNLNIYFTSQDAQDIQIDLYNQMGAKPETVVNTRTYHGVNQYAINTNNYAPGIYFIKVKYANQYYNEKVLIK